MNKSSKKKSDFKQYIGIAFMFVLGGVLGYVLIHCIDTYIAEKTLYEVTLLYLLFIIVMYGAYFLHMIIHEAGHLIFGLLTGYKFRSFRILSFMLLKDKEKLKLRRLSIVGTGGQCIMMPPDIKNGKMPFLLYNLGGSFLNVIASVLPLVIYFGYNDSPFLLIFAVIGFIAALTNGVPMRTSTINNDGYNALAISKSNEALEAFWVQLKVAEQNSNGLRIKDMPAEWFEVPTDESMKNSIVATRGVYACNRLMDEEKFSEADALMKHILEIDSGIVGVHRNLLICDRIYVELIFENREDVIKNMLTKEQKKFMKAMKSFPSVIRTEYALALFFEKNKAKAERIKKEFEKVAKTYPYAHEIDSERDLMKIAEGKFLA